MASCLAIYFNILVIAIDERIINKIFEWKYHNQNFNFNFNISLQYKYIQKNNHASTVTKFWKCEKLIEIEK